MVSLGSTEDWGSARMRGIRTGALAAPANSDALVMCPTILWYQGPFVLRQTAEARRSGAVDRLWELTLGATSLIQLLPVKLEL